MRFWPAITRLLAGSLAAGWLAIPDGALLAGERCQAFIDGLRDPNRGFYDLALDYLEAMRTSPLADAPFRETIDYEVGATLVQGSRLLPFQQRQKQLAQAGEYFRKFLAGHPQHRRAVEAETYLANLLMERGRSSADHARRPGVTPPQKQQLLEESRQCYKDGQQALLTLGEQLKKQREGLNRIDAANPAMVAQRNRNWRDSLLERLALAKSYYDIAQTYEPGSKDNKDKLTVAANELGRYYEKHRRFPIYANYGLVEQARCYKELGDYDQCLAILGKLIAPKEDDDDALRRLRSEATELAMQTTLLPQVKKYREALGLFENWEAKLQQPGEPDDQAAALRCLAAEAALQLARGLDEANPEQARLRNVYRKRAGDLLALVARLPGEYQQQARQMQGDPLLNGGPLHVEPPVNYDEARSRAVQAWKQLQDPELTPADVERLRDEARQCFRFALAHPSDKVQIDELNALRGCLASLDWLAGDFYDAAVLGEFLARRYPDRPQGPAGADIARRAYAGLLSADAPGEDHRFETARILSLARFASQRWPESDVADEAWIAAIRAAILGREPKQAAEYLAHVAPQSPRRSDAELATGQALWSAYLEAMRLPPAQQPPKADLTAMLDLARRTLEDGIGRQRKAIDAGQAVSHPLVAAALSLAQIYLDLGDGETAARWLDDPKLGPHTLATADDKAAGAAGFRVETLKAALRAYVATQQLDKAQQTMNALEKAGGVANLTVIYISLGRQLEESLGRIRAEGNREQAAKVARGFESFLARISARPAAEITFNSLYWVAETLMSLGSAAAAEGGSQTPEAQNDYQKAAEVYRRIIELCRADAKFAPKPTAVAGVQIRLARCLRLLGKFDEALDLLVEVLTARETLIDAQREAAYTYQAWGERDPGKFLLAIRGGQEAQRKPGGKANLILGWAGIARKVQFADAYEDLFHEARYNMALCRVGLALSCTGGEKTPLLRLAEQDILLIQRLQPEMGGKKWYPQYDALLRKIQGHLGTPEDQQGLKAAETRLSAATK